MTSPRLRRSLASLLIAAACASLAHAAAPTAATPAADTQSAKHAITHEDVWLMKRLGAPVASPDGKWAVFAVVDAA